MSTKLQLERLHNEFDVPDTARIGFHVDAMSGLCLGFFSETDDFMERVLNGFGKNKRGEPFQRLATKIPVTSDWPGFQQHLSFPQPAAHLIIVQICGK
ncbi:MAG: hypothetical protein MAGBODY4_01462 [Candidatus Marinimicrobia bacterium]|nr:hypothetical protein [Candidatus Neomarinimicrobiota bacterium]